MSKITIGVDADGVVYDFVAAAALWSGFDKSKATDWDIFAAWGAPNLWHRFDEWVQKGGICANLDLLEGAQWFVAKLRELGDVVIVTSPYRGAPTWAYEREQCILRDFGMPREKVLSMRSKQYAKVDVLIDDKPSNIETFPGTGVLFDQPWNQKCTAGTRCKSYEEVLNFVASIAW